MFALGLVDADVECGTLNGSPKRLLVQPRGECDRDDVAFEVRQYDWSEFCTSSYRLHGGWSWVFQAECADGAGGGVGLWKHF